MFRSTFYHAQGRLSEWNQGHVILQAWTFETGEWWTLDSGFVIKHGAGELKNYIFVNEKPDNTLDGCWFCLEVGLTSRILVTNSKKII